MHTARVLIPTVLHRKSFTVAGSMLPIAHLKGTTMGTNWSLSYVAGASPDQTTVEHTLVQTYTRIIQQMSGWDPTSELARFNASPAGQSIPISHDFQIVLARAFEIANATNGAYDPTCGQAVNQLGFGPLPGLPPRKNTPSRASWKEAHSACFHGDHLLQPGGLMLDLSSIAKGYTLDLAAKQLSAIGVQSFLLEIGGELYASGVKTDAQPWWVELESAPHANGERQKTILALCDMALATSGNYKRCRTVGTQRISHLVEPASGQSLNNRLASVSVIHTSCMDADAYATALYCLGPEAGPAHANQHKIAALFQTENGEEILTEGLSAMLA